MSYVFVFRLVTADARRHVMRWLYFYTFPAHGLLSFGRREIGLCSSARFLFKMKGDYCPSGCTVVVVRRLGQPFVRGTSCLIVNVPGGGLPRRG